MKSYDILPDDEAAVRKALMQATYVLWLLWTQLFMIGWLGVTKPEFQ